MRVAQRLFIEVEIKKLLAVPRYRSADYVLKEEGRMSCQCRVTHNVQLPNMWV